MVNTPFSGILYLALLSFCCRAQTVPPLIITTTHTVLCQNTDIAFEIQDGDSLSKIAYSMVPVKSWTIMPVMKGEKFFITFGNSGTYSLYISALDPDGTVRTGSTSLSVYRKPEASFNASLITQGFPNELWLTNYSQDFNNLRWLFSDGLVDSLDFVQRTYTAPGAQNVRLVAYGQNGCTDTSDYDFYINDSSGVTLPNIFTPNNDGINDVYRPIARGILHLSARVFSRDRIMLHSWDTVSGFWDGYTTSGMPCTDGVYFVVVEAIGFDDKKYSLSTYVQLMR